MRLDAHAGLDSPIHRWDGRTRILGLFALALSFAFVRDPRLLAPMLAASLSVCLLSRLPLRFVLGRLKYPGIFILALVVALPLASGGMVLAELGPLAVRREGSIEALMVAGRFAAIITLAVVIFGSASVQDNIRALRALGLPELLADLALFSYRYLEELSGEMSRMQRAARLRGFRATRLTVRNLRVISALLGSLLVRSHDRAELVHQAMVLRGYGSRSGKHKDDGFRATGRDLAALTAVLTVAAAFVALEVAL